MRHANKNFMICTFGSKPEAISLSLLTGLTGIFAAIVAISSRVFNKGLTPFPLFFAGGFFIYLAASKMVPEPHKEERFGRSVLQLIVSALGTTLSGFQVFTILNERIGFL